MTKDPTTLRPNQSMGLREWAEYLGVHRTTVYRHFKAQTWKLGNRRLLQKKHVSRKYPHLFGGSR